MLWAARAAWLGLVAAAGCGGLPASVSGTVTLDGAPLTTGLVTFLPTGPGAAAYGTIDATGRYSIRTGSKGGLAPGEYVVTVAANAPIPAAPTTVGGTKYAEPIMPLVTPLKYIKQDRTPLRATVTAGRQTIDFELTSR